MHYMSGQHRVLDLLIVVMFAYVVFKPVFRNFVSAVPTHPQPVKIKEKTSYKRNS